MKLFDYLKGKNNHALNFKAAYESGDMNQVQSVLVDWLDNGKHDALFGLAMVILVATRKDKPLLEAKAIYESSIQQDKGDLELFEWYDLTSRKLLDEWSGERQSSSKANADIDFDELDCGDFSEVFKDMYDELADVSYDKLDEHISRVNSLLDAWKNKCPDDSNLACAYVMVHVPEMSEDDLSEYVYKYASGKTYNESLKEWYQDGLAIAIKTHQARN